MRFRHSKLRILFGLRKDFRAARVRSNVTAIDSYETGIRPDLGQTSEPRLLNETRREKHRTNRSSMGDVALVGPPHWLYPLNLTSTLYYVIRSVMAAARTVSLSLCSNRSIVQILETRFVTFTSPLFVSHSLTQNTHTTTHTHTMSEFHTAEYGLQQDKMLYVHHPCPCTLPHSLT